MTTDTGYLSKTMAIIIHTCNGTTPYFLQSFSLFQNEQTIQYKSNNTSIPVLTSFEEEAVPGYIQFTGHLAQGGAITHGIK